MPPNAPYTSHRIINAILDYIDDESPEYTAKALGNGLLNYYFPLDDGFLIAPEQSRDRNKPDLLVLKFMDTTGGFRDHAFVECKKSGDPWGASMEQLSNAAFEHINADPFDRSFAIIIRGSEMKFFEYHSVQWRGPPPENVLGLVPIVPPGYDKWQAWDLKDSTHVAIIDRLFRYISHNDMPPER